MSLLKALEQDAESAFRWIEGVLGTELSAAEKAAIVFAKDFLSSLTNLGPVVLDAAKAGVEAAAAAIPAGGSAALAAAAAAAGEVAVKEGVPATKTDLINAAQAAYTTFKTNQPAASAGS